MAYSGKITRTGYLNIYTEFVRFICGNTSVAGRDWEVIDNIIDTTSGNINEWDYSGSLNVTQNNVWINLPTVNTFSYSFIRGGQTLVEGTDYNINTALGQIRFLTGDPPYAVSYSYKFRRTRLVVKNTGLSGNEAIFLGFLLQAHTDGTKANIICRVFRDYRQGVTDFYNTVLGNPRPYSNDGVVSMWNSVMDLWVFSSKARVIISINSNTIYSSGYIGQYRRFGMPSEILYPFCIFTDNRSDRWYDSTDTSRRFIAKATTGSVNYIMDAFAFWKNSYGIVPTQNDTDRWRTISYPTGFRKVLLPIYLVCDGNTYGTLDNVYFFPDSATSSESIITIGNDTYIVFQDVFRTGYADFMAIKEE